MAHSSNTGATPGRDEAPTLPSLGAGGLADPRIPRVPVVKHARNPFLRKAQVQARRGWRAARTFSIRYALHAIPLLGGLALGMGITAFMEGRARLERARAVEAAAQQGVVLALTEEQKRLVRTGALCDAALGEVFRQAVAEKSPLILSPRQENDLICRCHALDFCK